MRCDMKSIERKIDYKIRKEIYKEIDYKINEEIYSVMLQIKKKIA